MELWHRLSNIVDLPEVRRQLDQQHEIWVSEYDQFTEAQVDFVNKEIGDFKGSIVSMGDSLRDYQIYLTRAQESEQAMSQ